MDLAGTGRQRSTHERWFKSLPQGSRLVLQTGLSRLVFIAITLCFPLLAQLEQLSGVAELAAVPTSRSSIRLSWKSDGGRRYLERFDIYREAFTLGPDHLLEQVDSITKVAALWVEGGKHGLRVFKALDSGLKPGFWYCYRIQPIQKLGGRFPMSPIVCVFADPQLPSALKTPEPTAHARVPPPPTRAHVGEPERNRVASERIPAKTRRPSEKEPEGGNRTPVSVEPKPEHSPSSSATQPRPTAAVRPEVAPSEPVAAAERAAANGSRMIRAKPVSLDQRLSNPESKAIACSEAYEHRIQGHVTFEGRPVVGQVIMIQYKVRGVPPYKYFIETDQNGQFCFGALEEDLKYIVRPVDSLMSYRPNKHKFRLRDHLKTIEFEGY